MFTANHAYVQDNGPQDIYDPAETPGAQMCIQGMPVAPPNWFYPQHGLTRDWTHANAVEVQNEASASGVDVSIGGSPKDSISFVEDEFMRGSWVAAQIDADGTIHGTEARISKPRGVTY